jgi:outer membrane autotransporter protein
VGDDRHEKSDHDELIDETSRAEFGGRTTELAQRAGYPLSLAGAVWTPWVELTHRVQEVDSFTMSNPYVSDVTYSAAEAAETLAGIGIDAASEPLPVGEDASFRLRGGLFYTQSLARDDYRVTVSEASGSNLNREEVIEQPQLRQIGLNLGGELAVGERLAVGAGLTVTEDLDRGRDQEFSLRFSYRF